MAAPSTRTDPAPPDVLDLVARAADLAALHVGAITDADWSRATPCTGWNIRDLVRHMTVDLLAVPRVLAGESNTAVRASVSGAQLGGDHEVDAVAWRQAVATAQAALADPGALARIVDLGLGDFPGSELAWLVFTELLVHGWDVGTALGTDPTVPDDLAAACYRKLNAQFEILELSGVFGTPRRLGEAASPHDRLLAVVGRLADGSDVP